MAQRQATADKQAENGNGDQVASFEQDLAEYLQKRIKPGLNSGAIPLLARSIAKDIAHRERPVEASDEGEAEDEPAPDIDDQPTGEAEDEPEAEADEESEDYSDEEAADEADAEAEGEADAEAEDEGDDDEPEAEGNGQPDFETEMHELQADLGEDWIVRFSVQGDDEWLTAEKEDGSQRIEAATADVLVEAVGLLNERGRSS